MSFYLAIVSPLDTPLYELQFGSAKPTATSNSASSSTSSFPSWSTFTGSNGSDASIAAAGAGAGAGASASGSGSTGPGGAGGAGALAANANANLGLLGSGPGGEKHLLQMVAHASLDAVEETSEGTGTLYLKAVDRHNEWTVSAFIAANVKLILLHDQKNDDGIRLFFGDVWELYTKIALNPFHSVNTPIRNPLFETRVRASAKKFL
ncbi:uncharacterized protein EHS24_009642 [Apiotrichum porosum]|uniref:TRAPP subunit n=1 Tax=Apiotrichum porosum TaxID=105984 RepID=A0A427XM51_9TREE|nr:uncharacterized protein EHS24_009642 [Apiotrichum porosum]RSH79971.1 hypothetical protein EHS24_009642 [Apiotrichum porosum]